jgi:fatty-acyl-CoA synthase
MDFNLAELHEAIARAIPDRECMVWRDRRLSYARVTERTRRLANFLRARGLGGVRRERAGLRGWESGQDHLALYMYNCNEYLEGMLGAFKARVAPVNVNYRYVEEELLYLLRNARARGVVYHASFAPMVEKLRVEVPGLDVLIQVADESGHALLPGAVDYEAALAAASPERPDAAWSPDDLYILYTGGTTGMPKGVLWRQADIFVAALGGQLDDGSEFSSLDAVVERAKAGGMRSLPSPPMMHGAAHWAAFNAFHTGNTIVLQANNRHLDPDDVWSTCARERVNVLLIVGDAFGRPMIDRLREQRYDLSNLRVLVTGAAALSAGLKREFLELLPQVMIVDAVGSSESGSQGRHLSTAASGASTGTFLPTPGTVILDPEMQRVLDPGHDGDGWFAKRGRVPLGYFDDAEKTARTFPVIDGVRYTVPGDRARQRADGVIELLGRDSVTINSGGEKIFAEEVEQALKHHPAVNDAVVVGRPSERWGSEVVALVSFRAGRRATEAELLEECGRHLARYKLPKAFLFLDQIVRSPSGKADYRWAKEQALGAGGSAA